MARHVSFQFAIIVLMSAGNMIAQSQDNNLVQAKPAQKASAAQETRQDQTSQSVNETASVSRVTEPEVILTLADPNQPVYVWRPLRIEYSIINGSLPSGIQVTSLTLSIPEAMALKNSAQVNLGEKIELITQPFEMRKPGDRRDFPPLDLRKLTVSDLGVQLHSVLTYQPGRQIFFATLEYQSLEDNKKGTRTSQLVVEVRAHPLGMYYGALIGAILASALVVAYRLTRETSISSALIRSEFWIRLLRGAVATAIAILIFQTSSDIQLPVSVSVHDFYGGVLLGFFGDKVAETLMKRL